MARLIGLAMAYPDFAIVHVQSPCTTYNETYEVLRGNPKKGIMPTVYNVPADHNPAEKDAAFQLVRQPGIPLGVIYHAPHSVPFEQRLAALDTQAHVRTAQALVRAYQC
jgi:2-oxoglutarate ferredoxin oxidoreductase subunit beta